MPSIDLSSAPQKLTRLNLYKTYSASIILIIYSGVMMFRLLRVLLRYIFKSDVQLSCY